MDRLLVFLLGCCVTASAQKTCSDFSQAEADTILQVHNTLRSQVALGKYVANGVKTPTAADMMQMTWDCEAAAAAQKWISRCVWEHDNTAPKYGENLVGFGGANSNFSAQSGLMWEGEMKDMASTFKQGAKFPSEIYMKIGHASQMIWSSSNLLGCGVAKCDGSSKSGGMKVLVSCKYAKRGNMKGGNMYTTGATCSQCPEGSTCQKDTGLCVGKGASPASVSKANTSEKATTPKATSSGKSAATTAKPNGKTATTTKPTVKPSGKATTAKPKDSGKSAATDGFADGTCSRMEKKDAETLLKTHNTLRSKVALGKYVANNKFTLPTAADMMEMTWDCAAATAAQKYADQCVARPEKNPLYGEVMRGGAGEDYAVFSSKGLLLADGMFKKGTTYTGKVFGVNDATQMIWSSSSKLGCAVAKCEGKPISPIIVCKYSKRGNVVGSNVYTSGKTCSKCPSGSTCQKDTGLCTIAKTDSKTNAKPTAKTANNTVVKKETEEPLPSCPIQRAAVLKQREEAKKKAQQQTNKGGADKKTVKKEEKTASSTIAPPSVGANGNTCSQFSKEEAAAIVLAHNALRSRVALGIFVATGKIKSPTAADMTQMEWDCDAAKASQAYADLCPSGHSKNTPQYGENLIGGDIRPVTEFHNLKGELDNAGPLFQGPANETHVRFTTGKYGSNVVGHATQMIWARTNLVGCGVNKCGKGGFTVCKYFRRGNIIGGDVYAKGKTCSQCPQGTTCQKETGLCATPTGAKQTKAIAAYVQKTKHYIVKEKEKVSCKASLECPGDSQCSKGMCVTATN